MRYILDASFFFGEYPFSGEFATTPQVATELRDVTSKMRFEVMQSRGLNICEADAAATDRVREAAKRSGDLRVLSETDVSVIALALYLAGTVVSDDFAVQNVCRHLKIPVQNMMQKKAKRRVWKSICSGCGAEIPAGETECPICGSPPVRRGTENQSRKK
ncbi:MAG: nucleotide-binding protein [Methanocorpusculum sp.]|nr:nucleotide-binding protein [Methanocorpusculum sp.]MDE2521776.1 nucleotide-binding protein [Methanocorpusculum sp.]MDE2523993.1 nucleotide-binding protein [Methanocorpusculum sp.]